MYPPIQASGIRQCEKVKKYKLPVLLLIRMLNCSEFPGMRAAQKKIPLKCCFALRNVIIKYNELSGSAISNTLILTLLQYFLKELVIKGICHHHFL